MVTATANETAATATINETANETATPLTRKERVAKERAVRRKGNERIAFDIGTMPKVTGVVPLTPLGKDAKAANAARYDAIAAMRVDANFAPASGADWNGLFAHCAANANRYGATASEVAIIDAIYKVASANGTKALTGAGVKDAVASVNGNANANANSGKANRKVAANGIDPTCLVGVGVSKWHANDTTARYKDWLAVKAHFDSGNDSDFTIIDGKRYMPYAAFAVMFAKAASNLRYDIAPAHSAPKTKAGRAEWNGTDTPMVTIPAK